MNKVLVAGLAVLIIAGAAALAEHRMSDAGCGSYVNRSGHLVARPCGSPTGATARCADGRYSYSEHPGSSWTCSYHGGVVERLPR
jgi:hypothetical protein